MTITLNMIEADDAVIDQSNTAGLHLFFVDDDTNNRESFGLLVRRALRDFPGDVTLHVAECSEDLLEVLKRVDRSRAVLVTDNDMDPFISGTELARKIREFDTLMPIAIWSGNSDIVQTDPRRPASTEVFSKLDMTGLFKNFVQPSLEVILLQGVADGAKRPEGTAVPSVYPKPLSQG